MAQLYFEVEADWQKVVRLKESIVALESRLKGVDAGSKVWKELNATLSKTKEEFVSMTDTAAKAFSKRESIMLKEVQSTKANIDKIVEEYKRKEAEIIKAEEAIANHKSLKKKDGNAFFHDAVISRRTQEIAQLKKDLAGLEEQKAQLYFDYSQKNNTLKSFQGKGSSFEKATDYDKDFGKFKSTIQGLGEEADKAFQLAIKDGNDLKTIFGDLTQMASGVAIGNLISGGMTAGFNQIVSIKDKALQVRGEMQDIESTMKVFLKSEDRANKFVQDLEKAAYYNMFEFSDLVSASKEMIAYGVPTDEIIGRIDQLSEVATGTGSSLSQLVSMYDRAKSIGYVDSRTQQTWAAQGIVIKDVLAEMGEAATGSKIKFEDLNKVLDYMTKEGGMFHGVMKEQLNNISAEEGALSDSLHAMYNEMGQLIQGPYIQTLKFQTLMAQNWAEIARVLAGAVLTIGSYRAALVLLNVTSAASAKSKTTGIILEKAFAMAQKESTLAAIMNAQGQVTAAGAMKLYAKAALQATAATLTNPYVLAAAAIAGLCAAIYYFCTAESEAEKGANSAREAQDAYNEALEETRRKESNLVDVIGDTNALIREKVAAYNELCQMIPQLKQLYTLEEFAALSPEERKNVVKKMQKDKENANTISITSLTSKYADVDLRSAAATRAYDTQSVQNTQLYKDYVAVANALGDEVEYSYRDYKEILGYMQDAYQRNLATYNTRKDEIALEEEAGKLRSEKIAEAQSELDKAKQRRDLFRDILSGEKTEAEMDNLGVKAQNDHHKALKRRIDAQSKLNKLVATNKDNQNTDAINKAQRELEAAKADELEAENLLNNIRDAVKYAKDQESGSPTKIQYSWEMIGNTPVIQFYDSLNDEVNSAKGKLSALSTIFNGEEIRKDAADTYKYLNQFKQNLEKDNFALSKGMLEKFKSLNGGAGIRVKIGNETKQLLDVIREPEYIDEVTRQAVNEAINQELQNAKSKYETFNGDDIDGQKALSKARQRIIQAESIDKEEEKNRRNRVDNEFKAQELIVNAMTDGEEKKNKLRELNYKKAKETAERQLTDEIQTAKEAARKRWEEEQKLQDHDGKLRRNFNDNDLKRDTMYQAAVAIAYSKAENAAKEAYNAFVDVSDILNANKSLADQANEASSKYINEYTRLSKYISNLDTDSEEYKRALSARDELTRNYTKNSLKEYDDYESKKRDLDKKYADERIALDIQIATLRNQIQNTVAGADVTAIQNNIDMLEEMRRKLTEKAQTETAKLQKEEMKKNLEKLKSDPTYFMAFRDMSVVSSSALDTLNKRMTDFSNELSSLDPADFETIVNLMSKIDDELIKRNPAAAMKKLNDDLSVAAQEQKKNEQEYTEALEKEQAALIAVANAKIAVAAASTESERLDAQALLDEAADKQNNATAKRIDAQNKLNNSYIKVNSIVSQINKATDATRDKVKSIGDLIGTIGNQIGGIVGDIMNDVSSIIDDLMKVSELYDEYLKTKGDDGKKNGGISSTNLEDISQDASQSGNEKAAAAASSAAAVMQGAQLGISVGTKMADIFEKIGRSGDSKYSKFSKKLADVNKLTNAVNDYALSALKAQHAEDHWFGNSSLQALNDSWAEASKSSDNYYKLLNQKQAAYRDQTKHDGDWLGNIVAGSVAGAITGFAVGGNPYTAALGGVIGGVAGATTSYAEQALGNGKYNKDQVSAVDNLRIETRKKKKSFMWIGGRDQKTQDLRGWAREKFGEDLFDMDGWVNTELANKIMDEFGEKLTGETEATLQKLVDLKEEYDEYKKQLKDYVSSLYEPLAENMTSAIWEWYDSGRDALARFKEDASSTFRSIVNDLLKQVVLQKVFGKYEDEILGIYEQYNSQAIDETTLMQMVVNKTSAIMDTYESTIPVLEGMVTTIGDTLRENGIDLSDSSSSSSGGGSSFASASQDSIDETNGRLTAIEYVETMSYGQLVDLNTNMILLLTKSSECKHAIEDISRQLAESYLELVGIHDNTTSIATSSRIIAKLLKYDFYKHITKL